jgi:hypothetical protein
MDGEVHGRMNRPHGPVDLLIAASLTASCALILWVIITH